MKHIFIVGAKSIGQYGGYETFVSKLSEVHKGNSSIQYHIACKANGDGYMDESQLSGVSDVKKNGLNEVTDFTYNNAHVYKIKLPNLGAGTAIIYDIRALKHAIKYCIEQRIEQPIFYVLACRIGPFIKALKRRIESIGGLLYINPDGHEWKRAKWNYFIKKYWKHSERLMIKQADVVVCDSINIEKYIKNEYQVYSPRTVYIAYGADITPSSLEEDDASFSSWLKKFGLKNKEYYLIVGRFVPENNYETIIREFISSATKKKLVIISNKNEKLLKYLNRKFLIGQDKRICFAGTVYNQELLKKIRENAFAYIHGHEVGGTNPSLLEALGSTQLNLLLDVGFNKEVGEEAALYWTKQPGDLKRVIESSEELSQDQIIAYEQAAKKRILENYSWDHIGDKYLNLWNCSIEER